MTPFLPNPFILVVLVLFFRIQGHSSPAGFPFLKLGVGAVSQGMGEATLAHGEDASAVNSNPSALARLTHKEVFLYHNQFSLDTQYYYTAYAHPLKSGALGVSILHVSKGSFEGRDENRNKTGNFTAYDSQWSLAFARTLGEKTSLGAGIKGIRSKIGSFSSSGVALDLSGSYRFSPKVRLAGGIFHLGPDMTYIEKPVSLPRRIQGGLSYKAFKSLALEADARYGLVDSKFSFSLGGEYQLMKKTSFRAGYLSSREAARDAEKNNKILKALGGFSLGMGFNLFSSMNLDYAFVPMGDLENQHHMSLRWRFQ